MQESAVILPLNNDEHKKFSDEENELINLLTQIAVDNAIKNSYEKEVPGLSKV